MPSVSPTLKWIRLAQRIAVCIPLESMPAGVDLRVGTNALLLVRAGSAGETDARLGTAAPELLQ